MFQLMATSITQTGTRSAACKLVYDPSERRDVYIYIYTNKYLNVYLYIYIHMYSFTYIYINYINISYILLIQNPHFRTRWCPPITSRFMDISNSNLVYKSSLSIDLSTINPTVTVVINQWGRFKHHFSWSNLPFYPLPKGPSSRPPLLFLMFLWRCEIKMRKQDLFNGTSRILKWR